MDEGDEHSPSLLFIFSFSQSTSLMIIILLEPNVADVISTSSSELVDSGDVAQLLLLLLLLLLLSISLGTRSVNLFLLNRFLRLREGRVSGNGGGCVADDVTFTWYDCSCTRNGCCDDGGTIVVWLTGGGGLNIPSATRLCSNSNSWPMKFKFGEMIGRACFTNWYASRSVNDLYFITYAMAIVAERDIPAWQCNSTVDPFLRASSVNRNERKKKINQYIKVLRSHVYLSIFAFYFSMLLKRNRFKLLQMCIIRIAGGKRSQTIFFSWQEPNDF